MSYDPMPRQHQDLTDVMARRYGRFTDRMRGGDDNAAAEEFARLCHSLRRSDIRVSQHVMTAFMEGWLDLFWQCRRYDLMLAAAEDAVELFGEEAIWAFARGEALFNLGRFDEARQALEPLTTEDFDEPMLYYLLGCLAERGDTTAASATAERFFQAAYQLGPKQFSVPTTMREDEVVAEFEQCVHDLPEKLIWAVREMAIYVSALPSDELIHSIDPPLDPLALGVFLGAAGEGATGPWVADQPSILLFHKNIAKLSGDVEALEDELRRTLFHEIGRHLGLDDDQLEDLGLA